MLKVRQISLLALWLGFLGYGFFLAPPDDPETLTLITQLSTGDIRGVNPLIVALFNLMGILPIAYGCFLFVDGRDQKLPAWPFAVLSFGLGAFALLPYLALRQDNPTFSGSLNWWLKWQESKILALGLLTGAIALVVWGVTQGNWGDFVAQWHSSKFIHVMALDFVVLSCLFPTLLGDDLARRGGTDQSWLRAITWMPLVGALLYLLFRPKLNPEVKGG